MEPEQTRSASRKRRRQGGDQSGGPQSKVRATGRGKNLVGRYVRKEFAGSGVFLGEIVSYGAGLYRVKYEDGDYEDLDYREVTDVLISEEDDSNARLNDRWERLEEMLAPPGSQLPQQNMEATFAPPVIFPQQKMEETVSPPSVTPPQKPAPSDEDSLVINKLSSEVEVDGIGEPDIDEDADSSSDSCESARASVSETPPLQPLPLPPSSADLDVPDECISYLFSVYNFLRSFSHQLFLSPFSLNNFVGCVRCVSHNSLLDAIFLAVMRALKRHLEMLASDSFEPAKSCLRRIDWSLLDTLTWSVFVVEYLVLMGYTKRTDLKGFFTHISIGDFYSLPVVTKLRVLQILCDDVLDSAELRAEINMRESSDEEPEVNGDASVIPENGPKMVHPRYTKTSAYKDADAVEKNIDSNDQSLMGFKVVSQTSDSGGIVDDGNGDECRLCGMDGTLICCDGCPSAYHSRCIGLSKAHLPDGLWFCPECVVSKMNPTCSRVGKGLKGAEHFGVDPFEQVFVGTCNYLLILESSMDGEQVCRYYNHDDVINVLRLLYSSEQYALSYSEICKGISQYWEIPEESGFLQCVRKEASLLDDKENTVDSTSAQKLTTCSSAVKAELDGTSTGGSDDGNATMSRSGSDADNGRISLQEISCYKTATSRPLFNSDSVSNLLHSEKNDALHDHEAKYQIPEAKLQDQFGMESVLSAGSNVLPLESFFLKPQMNGNGLEIGGGQDANYVRYTGDKFGKKLSPAHAFKPLAYVNQYMLGDFAASAAANLAILTSEKGKNPEDYHTLNPSKVTTEQVSLQIKAFASTSLPFFWPNSERKILEVPREKCGWCLACKAPPSRKMGCLLNSAVSNALRGAGRALGAIRHVKNLGSPISIIAAYILQMEDSLHGLIVGPLLFGSYRKQWRKHVEMASTCRSLKYLLLELEENISRLALSATWTKLVDDSSAESSTAQNGAPNGSLPRRGPGLRRNKKLSGFSEDVDSCPDWWRGGRLLKMVFLNGILPSTAIKKAARQGGYRKIPGVSYAEEALRRSRQLAWRAAVEMSRNASQLALQVRCLDVHIRWSDLVRPEQTSQEGKGVDLETSSAFRNAIICDKNIVEEKIRYALVFGNQKHLPLRLMKNVVEVEAIEDGQEKLWFPDTHVPLYLVKEYEEKTDNIPDPPPKKSPLWLSTLQMRQLKACQQGDIFTYLWHKEDTPAKILCVSCQRDSLLRNAVQCNGCQGYCHKDCIIPSFMDVKDNSEFVLVCNKCHHEDFMLPNEDSPKQLKPKLSIQVPKAQPNLVDINLSRSAAIMDTSFQTHPHNSEPSSSRKDTSYGLIWKRNKSKTEDGGANFRLQNILLKGNTNVNPLLAPACSLCHQPYDLNLMYIRCEKCSNWTHADALELREEQIFDLEGFRCCKCRRKASPLCPYLDPDMKRKKLIVRSTKKRATASSTQASNKFSRSGAYYEDHFAVDSANLLMHPETGNAIYDSEAAEISTTLLHSQAEDDFMESDDPLLFSLDHGDPLTEVNMFESPIEWDAQQCVYQSPQKLPVRRHAKQMDEESSPVFDMENADHVETSIAEWDVQSGNGPVECASVDNMEFEPQTYFSFTELLASEDDKLGKPHGSTVQMDVLENWNRSVAACDDTGAVGEAVSYYDSFELDENGVMNNCHETTTMPCQMCHVTDPVPDLICLNCQLQIHSHCSPWVELPSFDASTWKCGACREWV